MFAIARVYFMKRVKETVNSVYNVSAADKSEDGQVCNLKFSCFTTTVA